MMPKITMQTPGAVAKKAGAVARIKRLEVTGGYKVNTYGYNGTGKTRFASTFPKPILWIIPPASKDPGELRSINTPENRRVIDQAVLESSGEVKELTEYVAGDGLAKCGKPYQTVVLDHATELQNLVLREILGLEKLPEQLGWGVAKQQDWQQCGLQTKELMRAIMDLSCHVVIIAQERVFNPRDGEDSESNVIAPTVGSALMPGTTGWLNTAADYIVQTFKRQRRVKKKVKLGGKEVEKWFDVPGKVDYCLRVGPDPTFTTKIRTAHGTEDIPDVIPDPTFAKFHKLVQEGKL
jgi:hypothetical protein